MRRDPNVDAVLTAVPIELNGSVLFAAIESGKHVLAEKPIADTARAARRILKACSRHETVVAVAENYRYRGDIIKASQVLKQGEIVGSCANAGMPVYCTHRGHGSHLDFGIAISLVAERGTTSFAVRRGVLISI